MHRGIGKELEYGGATHQPSLFVFDIQEEQVGPIKELTKNLGLDLAQLSPMIRAKLVKVNEEDFEKSQKAEGFETREMQREARFRNRGMNLTYRPKLLSSETIVSGGDYIGEYMGEEPIPVSLEQRFASRLNLSVGDLLEFSIQGVGIKTIVNNIRSVRWTSFHPNFFIQFPEGPINDAPKTFIATLPKMSVQTKELYQAGLFEVAPNASAIDVSKLVARISDLIDKMSLTLRGLSLLAAFSAFLIFISIVQNHIKQNFRDILLFKWIGFRKKNLLLLFSYEIFLVCGLALVTSVVLAQIMSYVIGRILFDSYWLDISKASLWTLILIPCISWFLSYFYTLKIFDISTKGESGI